MKYYLSSFKLGNETKKLAELIGKTSGKFGYISNAIDFTGADPIRKKNSDDENMRELEEYGATVEFLDLKNYFGKKEELKKKLQQLGGLYVGGGNTFVLRQAMKLSGFDELLIEMKERDDFLYVAFSAGVCVLCPSLKIYAMTDDANDFPYPQKKTQIWEGLGILDFTFEPHYRSDHPESASVEKEVQHCIDNKILFKAYRDGEVLIIE